MEQHPRVLVAVLLNPPLGTGTRSRNAVMRAASVLEYDDVRITNLCSVATPSVVEINALEQAAWDLARHDLGAALDGANAVLAAWGVAGLSGNARRWLHAQTEWFAGRAWAHDIVEYWTVGGEPRHPSRWHQFVSDKYGRTGPGTFEERIAQVLVTVPTQSFSQLDARAAPGSRRSTPA